MHRGAGHGRDGHSLRQVSPGRRPVGEGHQAGGRDLRAGPYGKLHLVALEYVVIAADWDALHAKPPALFGHTFNFTPSPNRFGLPPFYSLHAWVWKHNPAGMFEMWNPRVHCPAA